MKNSFAVFVMVCLFAGCTSPATLPVMSTALPAASQTPSAQPTSTALPTATQPPPTATITITPESSLKTSGPYLAYFRDAPYQFVLMDADGVGRKVIDVPDEIANGLASAYYQLGARYVSPDGEWLAFYTGFAGRPYGYEQKPQATFDLTLHLLNLSTGETQVITPLLSKDYPDNFTKALAEINDPLMRAEELQYVFLAGITQALAWSPDGKYLAFAGQMDGLSSDPYLYDMTTKKIRRLASDKEELQWIDWSSDGKWILYGSRLSNNIMGEYSVYSVARDNSSIHNLGDVFAIDWLNSHEILQYRMGIETYQMRLVDVATGTFKEIWRGDFYGYKVDPTGKWVVVYVLSTDMPPKEEQPGVVPGVRLINLKSLETIQDPDPVAALPLFLRAKDGTVIDLPSSVTYMSQMILASPDTKYWAVAGGQYVTIYSQDLTLVQGISFPLNDKKLKDAFRPDVMEWSPDSSGLFLVYGTNIYSVDISSGEVHLVETNLTGTYRPIGWINGK
ncbi:MAG: hypothetical protein EHM40_01235 [Chloroflexi bacterium]|nr:MAG: hypothetical protein EHM40_01235 [Chloroflexota bacterium]